MMPRRSFTAAHAARYLALACGVAVAGIGTSHLAGWLTGAAGGSAAALNDITMKANASLCLLLAGLALALLSVRGLPSPLRLAARGFAAVVLVLSALTLVEHLAGADLGIDQLLATERPGAAAVVSPNRMGPPASSCLVLLGGALVLLSRARFSGRFRNGHQPLAVVVAVWALLPVIGYLYEADELYGVARYTGIAWQTAVSLLVLAVGVLAARPNDGLMALVTADDPGGALIRRLLAPVILLPLVLGWLRLQGEHRGWFDAGMGTGLTMLLVIVTFSCIVMIGGRWVSRSEEDLRHNEETVRGQLAEIEAIYDSAHVGLAVFDAELRYVRINGRLAEMNGLPAAAHVGKTVREVLPDLAHDLERMAARVFETGHDAVDVEISGTTPSRRGERRTWVTQWVPLKGPAGQVVGINVAVEEVTERKRAEAELARAARALETARDEAAEAQATAERASRTKDHFLAVLSHELRTPLSPVLAGLALLDTEAGLSPRGRGIVEVARRNAELESRLIDDLLDLTRITKGKTELDRRDVDLRTVIDRAAEVCTPDIEARGLRLRMDLGPQPSIVHADAARLQQVFWNLLKNAIKFTPPGGDVEVRCLPAPGAVIVEVIDSGIGIQSSELDVIFDAFAQSERAISRRFGGLGLGLTISKALVEAHGGAIDARSDGQDKGATFVVRLPLASSPAVSEDTAEHPGEATAGRRALRVLLVEDHLDTADMMTAVLTLEGHEIHHARDVETALALMTGEGPFDLVLSDLGLPGRSGLDLMRELRARGFSVPGIALSGYGQETDVEQSRAAGFGIHLVKPAEPRVLLAAMDKVVRST